MLFFAHTSNTPWWFSIPGVLSPYFTMSNGSTCIISFITLLLPPSSTLPPIFDTTSLILVLIFDTKSWIFVLASGSTLSVPTPANASSSPKLNAPFNAVVSSSPFLATSNHLTFFCYVAIFQLPFSLIC